jgi:glycerate kinase
MRVLVAPDKFKGSLSATEVADGLAEGLAQSGVDVVTLPLADGGDGSVAAALAAGFQPHTCQVADALGRRRTTTIAVNGATAVVEVADSCGLSTLPRGTLAPMTASSYGFGEAISHAVELGAQRLVLALGGSASTDGGAGMLSALGYSFLNRDGEAMSPLAHNLHHIREIRADNAVDLRGIELIIARDVISPLIGRRGAAAVFGPQKGATISEIDHLEAGLELLVAAMRRSGWPEAPNLAATPGAGAAGGCGFAALTLGGQMVSGAEYFLDLLNFDQLVNGVDMVITGEGRLDTQTLVGKLPVVVAERAAPTPVIAVVGRNDLNGQHTGPFAAIWAVADYSATDTRHDPKRTAMCLIRIGTEIGQRLAIDYFPAELPIF